MDKMQGKEAKTTPPIPFIQELIQRSHPELDEALCRLLFRDLFSSQLGSGVSELFSSWDLFFLFLSQF